MDTLARRVREKVIKLEEVFPAKVVPKDDRVVVLFAPWSQHGVHPFPQLPMVCVAG
jgi:hypothetical protein